MKTPRREPRPLIVKKTDAYYVDRHHNCKTYSGNGITSRSAAKNAERKVVWRRTVLLK